MRPGAARPQPPVPPHHLSGEPGLSGAPGATPLLARPDAHTSRRRRPRRLLVAVLVLLLAWPLGLAFWADGRIEHVEALSGAPGTPGTTYLLAGSDVRGDGGIPLDGTEGARTDTIMLLHVPRWGPAALISLPRDTLADVPGVGPAKLNAAYSIGGPTLLVRAVEELSGLTVDHYVEVGLGGVGSVVDAVGGVELCLDRDVDEPLSGLVWTAGCHVADGPTALAFARMRYDDPQGDIGRAERQRQLISALTRDVARPSLVVDPARQVALAAAGTDALVTSPSTGIVDLARLALAFRRATGPEGVTGTPPIADPDHRAGGAGSTVLLDPELAPAFWVSLREGTLPAGPVGGLPQPS